MIINLPVVVPDWAKYVTQDKSGYWFAYKKKPTLSKKWSKFDKPHNTAKYIATGIPPNDFTKEIYRIVNGEFVELCNTSCACRFDEVTREQVAECLEHKEQRKQAVTKELERCMKVVSDSLSKNPLLAKFLNDEIRKDEE